MELVPEEDVKTRERKEFPSKYENALKEHVNWFLEKIKENGKIIIRINQLAKELGNKFEDIDKVSFYTGVKYYLWQHGIFVSLREHKDGSPILILRMRTENDELPRTLKKRFEQRYGKDGKEMKNNIEKN